MEQRLPLLRLEGSDHRIDEVVGKRYAACADLALAVSLIDLAVSGCDDVGWFATARLQKEPLLGTIDHLNAQHGQSHSARLDY